MGAKIWVPLVLSLVLGLGAAMMASKMLHGPHHSRSAGEGVSVVVAAHDIDAGAQLSPADLATIKYPSREVPQGAVTDPHQLLGRVCLAPLMQGQLASENLLAPAGMPAGLESLVPQGMRAVTLEVNEFSGLAGMITPGERVDVIANIRDDRTRETAARIIVQDLRVLAVGRALGAASSANASTPIPNNCTLLVTPKQAQAIQLASQSGRPWLALRGFKDYRTVNPGSTTLAELRGESAQDLAPKPVSDPFATTQPVVRTVAVEAPPSERVVRLILGNDEQRLTFQAPAPSSDDSQVTDTPQGFAIPR